MSLRWRTKKSKLPRWYFGMRNFGVGNEASVSLRDSRPWYGHFDYRNGDNIPRYHETIYHHRLRDSVMAGHYHVSPSSE